jgi:hypothetical protein
MDRRILRGKDGERVGGKLNEKMKVRNGGFEKRSKDGEISLNQWTIQF